ncbi:MAG: HAMP domain-containing histidine kinase [Pseudomonadales bacterium]|nr:HAMP domain-containing histidine kinase [Pseudomonadales bacterium]
MPATPLTTKTAPGTAKNAAPALAPLLKKLVIFQLALALIWVLASVAYALLISSSQRQTGIELPAQDLAQAFIAVPGTLLAGGWAMTLLVSLAALFAVNRQLSKESMTLTGTLPIMPDSAQTGFRHAGTAPLSKREPLPSDANSLAPAPDEYILIPVALVESIALAQEYATIATLATKPDLTPSTSLNELELAQQSAVKANRIKSNIIAKTSHELLTPLNSITGFAEILANDLPEASQHGEFAQLIYENALYLNTLVNDLIVISDRETNAIKLNYAHTDIHALLSSIAKTFAPAVAKHGLQWRENLSAIELIHCDTDGVRLRQIISNLLTNALRNTEQGYMPGCATRRD